MAETSNRREADLDVVRGIAILLAMGWHLNGVVTGSGIVQAVLSPGRVFGWAGVDLFFVLSGFLIGRIVLLEQRATGRFDARRFLLRRILRLWPVLYVYLIIQVCFGDKPWRTFLPQNLFHLQNYLGTSLSHLWSLAVEEQFYIVFSALFLILVRAGFDHRTLLKGLAATIVLGLLLRCIAVLNRVDPFVIQWETHYRMDTIAVGLVLATLSVHRPDVFERLRRDKAASLAVVAAAVAFLCLVPQTSWLNSTVGYTLTALGAAAFILALSGCDLPARLPVLFGPVAALSPYAYAIYIFHTTTAKAIDIVAAKAHVPLPPGVALCLHYAGALAVAVAVHVLIEKPCMALRARLSPSPVPVTGSRASAVRGAARLIGPSPRVLGEEKPS